MYSYFAAIPDTAIVLGILAAALALFVREVRRYDVVAGCVLFAVIAFGILPMKEAFAFFGHPVLIIIGSMFIMGRALVISGAIDAVVRKLNFLYGKPLWSLATLIALVTALSAFINNVGALAIVMTIAIFLARKSNTPIAMFLLPLAFASHLGGFLTLIGTPRNIIVSSFREQATGAPFSMFDFTYVGAGVAGIGLLFLISVAWRMIPAQRTRTDESSDINEYVIEAEVGDNSPVIGMGLSELHTHAHQCKLLSVYRAEVLITHPDEQFQFRAGDILTLSGVTDVLTQFTEEQRLRLVGLRAKESHVTTADEYGTMEAIITPYSNVIGMGWDAIALPRRFGVNFIGLSRAHALPRQRLSSVRLRAGDIMLLQGRLDSVRAAIARLNFLPLAERDVALGRTRTMLATTAIVFCAIFFASFTSFSIPVVFFAAAGALILFELISLRQAYDSIDWPVLVLLAGMLALGNAVADSGTASSLASILLSLYDLVGPLTMLALVLIFSMMISDFMNTTASAVIMSPVAVSLATIMGASIDPFLMAVAIGASSAFLTPIGHESNALVMEKGSYHFSDFMRVGVPLEILLIIIALPLIVFVWPMF